MLEERSTACKLLAFGLFLYEALSKVAGGGGRGGLDPVSHTSFRKIHASRAL